MQTDTIVYIIIAGIAALLLTLFQYIYKSKQRLKLSYSLALLRFTSIFGILLLLINPKFESISYYDEKPNLVIALDNSESVKYLKQDDNVKAFYNQLTSNKQLQERFNIESYTFGEDFKTLDSIDFSERQSNMSNAFKSYSEIYKNTISPIIFITDGNQTYGSDYQYIGAKLKQPIYPIILGDTITFSDLRIQQLNVNRFAYLKNRFPVEVIANYNGVETVNSVLRIYSGNAVVFSKTIDFSASKTSEIINTTLPASSVGVKTYRVEITPLANERNTVNNSKNFAVEVIDQKTNVAIVSERTHPDLGALKKAIESNEQRSATILYPKEFISKINDFQLVVLYQPNNNFANILSEVARLKLNTFTIAGKTTNWNLLNESQQFFKQEITNQTEDYQPSLNTNYSTFIINNLNFESYPPLHSEFGDLYFIVPEETVLFRTINGNITSTPLLSTFETNGGKHAILNGEGIWRWRAQSYLNSESFNDFDNFIGKLIQYLSSNKKRNRINADYKSFYNGNDNITISAQFFNKNFEFDANANLLITLKNEDDKSVQSFPLLLKNSSYSIDLAGTKPGNYTFTLKSNDEPISISGKFKVLEYNVEQQFLNADVTKLKTLATNSKGQSYFIEKADTIVTDLLNDNRFATVQKSNKTTMPLIDWKYLLGLIALALSLEWFIRKYNGLI
jgi:hypothetical protein